MVMLKTAIIIFFLIGSCLAKVCIKTRRRSFGQLPTALMPVKYRLSVQPYFPADNVSYPSEKNFTFDANLTIVIDCLDDTNNITLNMLNIILEKEGMGLTNLALNTKEDIKSYNYDNKSQQVTFCPSAPLKAGQTYQLQLKYSGKVDPNSLTGFYSSPYVEWIAVTQLESSSARMFIPSFDEPFYKAIFEITVIHPTSMTALSNTMDDKTEKFSNGWSKTTFAPTPKMSTYLLAIAVCDYQSKSAYTADNKTLFRVWARPSFINKTDYAVFAGPKVLDFYKKYFNIPFPLSKQDMIALPNFRAGAMENWGLVTYRESMLLFSEVDSTPNDLLSVAQTISHELAHQWFGNLVTMEWWGDVWLNEGFATYMQFIGADVISDGKFKMDEYFVATYMSIIIADDQMPGSHPIYNPVFLAFDGITYAKSAAVIRMLNYTISNSAMQKGLTTYLKKHEYGNANHDHLWSALSEAVNADGLPLDWRKKPLNVSEFMSPWILQPGYPLITVARQYDKKPHTATLTQERYIVSDNTTGGMNSELGSSSPNLTWYVPIWYENTHEKEVQFTWLEPEQILTVPTGEDNQWILVNHERAAYCRVNYDERNWQLLIQQLQTDHEKINIKSRIQLIDDSMEMAKTNHISVELPLNLSLYLVNEKSYGPWFAAKKNIITFLQSAVMSSPAYQDYKKYVTSLIHPTYKRLGWDNTKDDVYNQLLRQMAIEIECSLEFDDCVQKAKTEFSRFVSSCSSKDAMSSVCSPISALFRVTVYCEGARDDRNTSGWDLLWSLYAIEQAPSERNNLLQGLACTKTPSLVSKLLKEAINVNSTIIRRQDADLVFVFLSSNVAARQLLWPFIEQNWEAFIKDYNDQTKFYYDMILTYASSFFQTEYQVKDLKKFYNDHSAKLGLVKESFEQLVKNVEARVERAAHDGFARDVTQWLKKQHWSI